MIHHFKSYTCTGTKQHEIGMKPDTWTKGKRIQDPEINPATYSQLSQQRCQEHELRRTNLPNKQCWVNKISSWSKCNLESPLLIFLHWKSNQNESKAQNSEASRRKHTRNIQDNGTSNDFLKKSLLAQQTKARSEKWGYIKLKRFCAAKGKTNKQTSKRTKTNQKQTNRQWETTYSEENLC